MQWRVMKESTATNKSKQHLRPLNGLLLLDKPIGLSSNSALQIVKRLYKANKAGHTGSLDPLASGMLPICFGEATKFSQFLLDADKTYQVTARLGIKTTTADAEGEIVEERPIPEITAAKLNEVLKKFTGEILQTPSMYSALKHQGRPLYEYARKGINLERAARKVTIHEIKLLAQDEKTFSLYVACSKGTYIRNLVEDIGESLNCGAHVTTLSRLSVAGFENQQMHLLADIEALDKQNDLNLLDQYLLPVENILKHLPLVKVSEAAAYYLIRGQAIFVPYAPDLKGEVRLMFIDGKFLGVGEVLKDGKIIAKRLISQNT